MAGSAYTTTSGTIAEPEERRTRIAEVVGSSPIRSTSPLAWDPVRTVVSSLRRKLGDDADNPAYIFNEPRVGYRMPKGEG